MKTFRQFIYEMNLDGIEPSDDVIDLRGQKPNVKAGDYWATSRTGTRRKITKQEADDINSGKAKGGSPFSNKPSDTKIITKNEPRPKMNPIPKSTPAPAPQTAPKKPTVAQNDDGQPKSGVDAWLKAHPKMAAALNKSTTSAPSPAPQNNTQKDNQPQSNNNGEPKSGVDAWLKAHPKMATAIKKS